MWLLLLLLPLFLLSAACGGTPSGRSPSGDAGTGTDGAATRCSGVFQDDFAASEIDEAKWRTVGVTGWTLDLVDGVLVWQPRPGHDNTRTGLMISRTTFDMTGCSVQLQVVSALPNPHSGELNVGVTSGSVQGFVKISNGYMTFVVNLADDSESAMVQVDPTQDSWLRFSEEDGALILKTSRDATQWTERFRREHESVLDDTSIRLNVIDTSLRDDFAGPRFDNVDTR